MPEESDAAAPAVLLDEHCQPLRTGADRADGHPALPIGEAGVEALGDRILRGGDDAAVKQLVDLGEGFHLLSFDPRGITRSTRPRACIRCVADERSSAGICWIASDGTSNACLRVPVGISASASISGEESIASICASEIFRLGLYLRE